MPTLHCDNFLCIFLVVDPTSLCAWISFSNRTIERWLDKVVQMKSLKNFLLIAVYSVLDHDKWDCRQNKLWIPRCAQFVLTMFEVGQSWPKFVMPMCEWMAGLVQHHSLCLSSVKGQHGHTYWELKSKAHYRTHRWSYYQSVSDKSWCNRRASRSNAAQAVWTGWDISFTRAFEKGKSSVDSWL